MQDAQLVTERQDLQLHGSAAAERQDGQEGCD
jgi:hypothetical protein